MTQLHRIRVARTTRKFPTWDESMGIEGPEALKSVIAKYHLMPKNASP